MNPSSFVYLHCVRKRGHIVLRSLHLDVVEVHFFLFLKCSAGRKKKMAASSKCAHLPRCYDCIDEAMQSLLCRANKVDIWDSRRTNLKEHYDVIAKKK